MGPSPGRIRGAPPASNGKQPRRRPLTISKRPRSSPRRLTITPRSPRGRRPKLDSHTETAELREQFATPGQQKEISTLGMWIFLVTEIMFFGGLFLAYAIYRREFAGAFEVASNTLDVVVGAVNTAVLLCSSFTMVLAVHAAQIGSRKALIWFLILTILLGGVFLGVKAYELNLKFDEHHVPGPSFHLEGTDR